jgi:hypothetical protein
MLHACVFVQSRLECRHQTPIFLLTSGLAAPRSGKEEDIRPTVVPSIKSTCIPVGFPHLRLRS